MRFNLCFPMRGDNYLSTPALYRKFPSLIHVDLPIEELKHLLYIHIYSNGIHSQTLAMSRKSTLIVKKDLLFKDLYLI